MQRATSFGAVADDYDRLRPTPPPQAVEWILQGRAAVAVDVAAGTGVMTRELLARPQRVGRVIAVEPDPRMRAVLTRRTPGAEVLEGRGEGLPLPSDSADLIVVASAWHWIDASLAVPEIGRVLRDGGRLAVLWSGRDTRVAWMREVFEAALPGQDAERDERQRRMRALVVPDGQPFTAVDSAEFDFTQRMTVADLAAAVGTYSRIIVMGPERAAEAMSCARRRLADRFGGDDVEIDVPFRSRAFRCDRLPRTAG